MRKNKGPKILYLDVETTPNELYSWRIGSKVNLSYDSIIKERYIVCAAWKWHGGKRIFSSRAGSRHTHQPDRRLVQKLYRLLASADAVCGHNINKFDIPYIVSRGIIAGLKPFPPIKRIDTYLIARKIGYFNCNRLDYLAKVLGIGKKIKTDYELWKQCAVGNKAALDRMARYNIQDVRLLPKVLERLRPYAPNTINRALLDPSNIGCPECGSSKIQYRGWAYTRTGKYPRFVCKLCGSWGRDTKRIDTATKVGL